MQRIAVVTAVTNNRDRLQDPIIVNHNYDYYCFSDVLFQSRIWNVIQITAENNPILAARKVKILCHEYLPGYDIILWQDASMRIRKDLTVLIEELQDFEIAAFSHRWRRCLYEEATNCIETNKDKQEIIFKQIEKYNECCFPVNYGLFETGILLRRICPQTIGLNELWWKEVQENSVRDQLSFTYALWAHNITCKKLMGDVEENSYFYFDIFNHNPNIRTILTKLRAGTSISTLAKRYYVSEESILKWEKKYR